MEQHIYAHLNEHTTHVIFILLNYIPCLLNSASKEATAAKS
jgi:hypothetical protein